MQKLDLFKFKLFFPEDYYTQCFQKKGILRNFLNPEDQRNCRTEKFQKKIN